MRASALAQSYNFTTLDNPTAGGSTIAYGVNNLGQVVGNTNGSQGGFFYGGGTYTTIAFPSPPAFGTTPHGINDPGQIAGAMVADITTVGSGFVYSGGTYSALPIGNPSAGLIDTVGWGINNSGKIVGTYLQGSGFIYDGSSFTRLQATGASGDTIARGINNANEVAGYYFEATSGGNVTHGFVYSGGTFTTIDTPLGGQTRINAINDSGWIVGTYLNGGQSHAFAEIAGQFYTIDNPGATNTVAYGINNAGQIVGSYDDATGTHGFLAMPVNVNIDLRGINQTVGSLNGGGSVTNSGVGSPATLTVGVDNSNARFDGVIQDGASATALIKVGTGTQILGGSNSYTGGTTLSAGALAVFADNNLGATSGGLIFDGGTLKFLATFTSNRGVTLNAGGGTLSDDAGVTLGGMIGGTGRLTKVGNAFTVLSGTNNYSGGSTISAGGLVVTNNSALGSGAVTLDGGKLVAGADGLNIANAILVNSTGGSVGTSGYALTLSGLIADGNGSGALEKTGTGTLILTRANTYSGGTTVSGGTLQINTNMSAGSGQMMLNGGTLRAGANNLILSNAVAIGAAAGGFDTNGNTFTVSSNIVDGIGPGALAKFGAGTLVLSGTNSYSGGTSIHAGAIAATNNSALGTGMIYLEGGTFQAGANNLTFSNAVFVNAVSGGGTIDTSSYTLTLSGGLSGNTGSSGLTKTGLGTLALLGSTSFLGAVTVDSGTLLGAAPNVLPRGSMAVNASAMVDLGGFLQSNLNVALNGGTIQNGTASGLIVSAGGTIKDIGGTAAVVGVSGTTTFIGTNTYAGSTNVGSSFLPANAVLMAGAANTFSALSTTAIGTHATLDLGGFAQTINTVFLENGTIQNGVLTGNLTSIGGTIRDLGGSVTVTTTSGTTIVAGNNSYTGATILNGGILNVVGFMASSSLITVNAGGALTGIGTVGRTTIASGGMLAPGNGAPGSSLTISGNLAFQSGALFLVQLNPATSTFANVTGTASLNGGAGAAFLAGSYVSKQYTILTAASGVNGNFGSFNTSNLPSGFTANLSYDTNSVTLNLVLAFPNFGSGLSGNQQNVGNALINYFDSTGGIPAVFGSLRPADLTQLSGTAATSSQQNTSIAMTQFLSMMLDPSIDGRGDISAPTAAMPFAEEQWKGAVRGAYAAIDRKVAPVEKTFAQRWSVWAAAYGGSQTTEGNASAGTNTVSSRIVGTAAGADYHLSSSTLVGFALAGGGTSFSVANGLGGGRSDLFQAGAFIRQGMGPAYLSAALAYGWQDVTTDRTVTIAGIDRLRAQFNANAWSGRVEGSYRFVGAWTAGVGLTPYAAGQFTTLDLPAYAEQAIVGTNIFALAYSAKSVTDTRSELGLRTDKSFVMPEGVLTLRSRAAWAHDFNPDHAVAATFQTLPGASFVVNGAAMASDSALVTGAAEMKWLNHWSAAATFEGEFSNVTRSYAGKGAIRYTW
ncbi:autotransporter domain-containing protein [Bradyrhizobium sp. SSUT112]|uniref:autotransporter outer membrane beta-barrel domain-containing protein n=1 Tax=Bradyrhizobium sp. SSUT112 TaxID=3040604 RepID=UPI00244B1A35|nr:autotransporter domain-containing protein [Bradyrhizobium sp. SSUT112]MDH2352276.1 autotransporter domain-containing protein [Bradyrhizobium sp. SSUT112]